MTTEAFHGLQIVISCCGSSMVVIIKTNLCIINHSKPPLRYWWQTNRVILPIWDHLSTPVVDPAQMSTNQDHNQNGSCMPTIVMYISCINSCTVIASSEKRVIYIICLRNNADQHCKTTPGWFTDRCSIRSLRSDQDKMDASGVLYPVVPPKSDVGSFYWSDLKTWWL